MIALTQIQWVLIAALGTAYVVTCFRVARWAKLTGRSPVRWFLITLFCTALPAAIVHHISAIRGSVSRVGSEDKNGGSVRENDASISSLCPHCGAHTDVGDLGREESRGQPVCPNCGMVLNEDRLA